MSPRVDLSWYAVQTRPRAELLVSSLLEHKGYETFVPLYSPSATARNPVAGSRRRQVPLFSGYLFCRNTEFSSGLIVTTPSVLRLVGFGNSPVAIPDFEIVTIRRALASWLPLRPWPQLEPGEVVELTAGPLTGCKGVLLSYKNELQLIVSIILLQRSIAIEVQRSWVTPARKQAGMARAYSGTVQGAA
jgi:transcription antitermination factor NusG